jgi:uncharacterized protein YacL
MFFALIKSVVFSFIVVTISSFQGFHTQGGAYEVGKASTSAVTNSCIAILIAEAFFHLHISCLPSLLFVLLTETFLLKLFGLLFDINQQSDELLHLLTHLAF